jgi:hypothetical protein
MWLPIPRRMGGLETGDSVREVYKGAWVAIDTGLVDVESFGREIRESERDIETVGYYSIGSWVEVVGEARAALVGCWFWG